MSDENLNQVLAEAMIHVDLCKNLWRFVLTPCGETMRYPPVELSANEIDEYMQRFVRSFYPDYFEGLFNGN